jgi:AcrR family transcriptional regulator
MFQLLVDEPDTNQRADARRNRTAVLDAAVKLLAEQPQSSMREIADASGVGRTTVYRHFPSREDLMRALFRVVIDESRAMSAAIAAKNLPVDEALREYAVSVVGLGLRYRFLKGQRHLRDEVIASEEQAYDDPFEAYLLAAQQRGEVRSNAPIAWLMAMLSGQTIAGLDLMNSGGVDREAAERLLGDSLVATFCRVDSGA